MFHLLYFSITISCAHAPSGLWNFWHQGICLVYLCIPVLPPPLLSLCSQIGTLLRVSQCLLNVDPSVLWPSRSQPDWLYGWQSSLSKGMPQTAKYGCRIQEHQMQNIFQIFIASKQSQLAEKAQQASERKRERQRQPLCFLVNNENIKINYFTMNG